MSNPLQLFLKRLTFDLLEIHKVFRVVIDWTVALYIIVPNLIISIAFYIEWWRELPSIFQTFTFNKLLIITFFTFFLNDIKSFIYSADQLFLIQNTKLLRKITLYGLIYSLIIIFFSTIISTVVILPVLVNKFNFSIESILWFFLYYTSSYMAFSVIRKTIKIYSRSFLLKVLSSIIILTTYLSLWYCSLSSIHVKIFVIVILLMITVILSRMILFSRKQFIKLVDLNEIIRNKWTKIILSQGGHAKLLNSRQTYKPWILKGSKLLLKHNAVYNILTDAFIKSFIRDKNTILTFLQLFMLLIVALLLLSNFWARFIIWGFAIYAITAALKNSWFAFRYSSFINMFQWEYIDLIKSFKKSIYVLAYPFVIIVGALFGYLNFSLAGGIIFPFISVILSFLIIMFSTRRIYKKHKNF